MEVFRFRSRLDGTLDFGILANARRKGSPPFSQYLDRFPRFNSTELLHQFYFTQQFNGWKSVGAKGYGFDTGGTMYDPMLGESTQAIHLDGSGIELKPYGEAVPLVNLGNGNWGKKEDAVYEQHLTWQSIMARKSQQQALMVQSPTGIESGDRSSLIP